MREGLVVALLAIVLASAFQGSRGLWDPDEGRYTNVALEMLDSGDWILPHRHHESLHVTKPPLTYWAMAASFAAFGRNEWAARLPNAVAFALTVLLVYQLGRVFVPGRPWLPALVYATSPVPFLAANWISTDTPLAWAETLAVAAYAQARFGARRRGDVRAMWVAFGLAFLVKGPPAIVPLLAIAAFEWLDRDRRARLFDPPGLAAFGLLSFGWFAYVAHEIPALVGYFVGHEFVDRVASAEMRRFPEWYGPFVVYAPTLLLGALPWLVAAWRHRGPRVAWSNWSPQARFLALWLALPLLVFALARSRLPLYILPLFVPASLLLARALDDVPFGRVAWRRVAVLVVVLIAVKAALAYRETGKDARALAAEMRRILPADAREIVYVDDMARYGLHLYLGTEIEKVSIAPLRGPQPVADAEYDSSLAYELGEIEAGRYFVVRDADVARWADAVRDHGDVPVELGALRGRRVFAVR